MSEPAKMTMHQLRKALASNSTDNSWSAKAPTTTKPSGNGVFELSASGKVDKWLVLQPFGSDAQNEAFDVRVWGWVKGDDDDSTISNLWVPALLADLTCTLGNIAASDLGTNNFLADTITENDGDSDGGVLVETVSPAEDLPSAVHVNLRGCGLMEFAFNRDTAAPANCLFRPMSM